MPVWSQWLSSPKILNFKERFTLLAVLFLLLVSLVSTVLAIYYLKFEPAPDYGGSYTEALIGQPKFINPLLAETSDADRDITQLVFSGLMKYTANGSIAPDLSQKYEISEDGKSYTFWLKKNILWHDGAPFNADDVVFTINAIKNTDYQSPLRSNWQGVEIIKVDDYQVRFTLNNPYVPFLDNTTLGILPKHLWDITTARNFPLAELNLKPIGTGPYKFDKFQKDSFGSILFYTLRANEKYHPHKPYIDKITFKFYGTEEGSIVNLNRGLTNGIANLTAKNKILLKNRKIILHALHLPRYFAVFFNQAQNKILSDKSVRQALAYSVNKKNIIKDVMFGEASIADSPLLSNFIGISPENPYNFDPDKAKQILKDDGWQDKNKDGILDKKIGNDREPTNLEIKLTTSDWPELFNVAKILKSQWEALGAKVDLDIVNSQDIQQNVIRPRNYQALIFGEVLGADPDPYSFWHSSQKLDPGLNLALYDNKSVDKLLEDARSTLDQNERLAKLNEFQKLVVEDVPAIFLYSPTYLYPVASKIKNVAMQNIAVPSQRFADIAEWHIKGKRVLKILSLQASIFTNLFNNIKSFYKNL